jgi:uncharacterized protein with GYD domain
MPDTCVLSWLCKAVNRELAPEQSRLAEARAQLESVGLVVTAAVALAGARGVPRELRNRANAVLIASLPAAPTREPGTRVAPRRLAGG